MIWEIRFARNLLLAYIVLVPGMSHATLDWCQSLTKKQIQKNIAIADAAVELAPYAIMSNNVYGRADQFMALPAGWEEVAAVRNEMPKVGLALTAFEKHEGGVRTKVVVVFRGTDEKQDWVQNLVPFFRNQIKPASAAFEEIRARYEGQPVKFIATGHSLGGGLAFHMSFTYPNVEAIAFNSSPVTKAGMTIQAGNKQTSVWESGEGLQAVRNLVSGTRIRWHGVRRIEYRFLHGLPFKQHGMASLALNLIKLAGLRSSELQAITASQCAQ